MKKLSFGTPLTNGLSDSQVSKIYNFWIKNAFRDHGLVRWKGHNNLRKLLHTLCKHLLKLDESQYTIDTVFIANRHPGVTTLAFANGVAIRVSQTIGEVHVKPTLEIVHPNGNCETLFPKEYMSNILLLQQFALRIKELI